MGLWQPDMKRKRACLRAEAEQKAETCRPDLCGVFAAAQRHLCKFGEKERACRVVEQENTHQHHQTAKNGHRQISCACSHGFRLFIVYHPYIGSKRHHFKEEEGGVKVCGKEDAFRRAKGQQQKQIVAILAAVVFKIFSGKQGGHKPHEGGYGSIQSAKAVKGKVYAHTKIQAV